MNKDRLYTKEEMREHLRVQAEEIFKAIDKDIKENLTTDEYDNYNIEADIENFVINIEKTKHKFLKVEK